MMLLDFLMEGRKVILFDNSYKPQDNVPKLISRQVLAHQIHSKMYKVSISPST